MKEMSKMDSYEQPRMEIFVQEAESVIITSGESLKEEPTDDTYDWGGLF